MTAPLPDRLAQAIHDARDAGWVSDSDLAAALLPLIEDYSTERAVKVLRDLAERPAAMNINTPRHDTGRDWLNYCADRLEDK